MLTGDAAPQPTKTECIQRAWLASPCPEVLSENLRQQHDPYGLCTTPRKGLFLLSSAEFPMPSRVAVDKTSYFLANLYSPLFTSIGRNRP